MPYLDGTHWCGAKPGEPHKDWDDVALCYISGQQLIACDDYWLRDDDDEEIPNPDHQCHPSVWDGEYPGILQARKYELYTYVVELDGEYKLSEDINSVYLYGTWNVETQQHEISEEVLKEIKRKRSRA